jgi:cytochrome b subunit of formate dehydrogenase
MHDSHRYSRDLPETDRIRAGDGRRHALAIALAVLLLSASAPAQETDPQNPDRRCLACHGQPHIAELGPEERAQMVATWLGPAAGPRAEPGPAEPPRQDEEVAATRPGLYVQREDLAHSAHPEVHCVECHEDAERLPHPSRLNLDTCASECHAEEYRGVEAGFHTEARRRGDDPIPTCVSCHGGHDIVSASSRGAPAHHLNNLFLCGDCHAKHRDSEGGEGAAQARVAAYSSSAHGVGVTSSGLVTSATCVDCHGAHEVHPASDPRSPVHRENIPETCGRCHLGVVEVYADSIHGQLLAEGDERGPVCSDCHTSHGITRTASSAFILDVVDECGDCHDDPEMSGLSKGTYYETYRRSYHGQVNELGSVRAARCSDCHGAHDTAKSTCPTSRVHPDNLVATCGTAECHPGANRNFVLFDPHADYRDGENYPILHGVWIYFMIVMSGAFGFFGIHSLLWFGRSLIERIRHGPLVHHPRWEHPIRRFTTMDRVNHLFVVITFLGLTASGIPLLFPQEPWSAWLVFLFGGVEMAGTWHRIFAFLLFVNLFVHFVVLIVRARRRTVSLREWLLGPNSMMPRMKDVRDCLGMFRWFFFGGEKPRFDRWTYWEKFDYWCEIGGTGIIGGSGLLLWFPILASTILPGWMFNVATVVHGYEALLAIGFIFTIHFFNANLRIEKFPVDEVILSGHLPEAELAEERPVEYERLHATGELSQLRVEPWERWKVRVGVVLGILAMVFGMTLVALMILAGFDLI